MPSIKNHDEFIALVREYADPDKDFREIEPLFEKYLKAIHPGEKSKTKTNLQTLTREGEHALSVACSRKEYRGVNFELINYLLKKAEASKASIVNRGKPEIPTVPLLMLCERPEGTQDNCAQAIKSLLQHGANPYIYKEEEKGGTFLAVDTPVSLAIRHHNMDAYEVLSASPHIITNVNSQPCFAGDEMARAVVPEDHITIPPLDVVKLQLLATYANYVRLRSGVRSDKLQPKMEEWMTSLIKTNPSLKDHVSDLHTQGIVENIITSVRNPGVAGAKEKVYELLYISEAAKAHADTILSPAPPKQKLPSPSKKTSSAPHASPQGTMLPPIAGGRNHTHSPKTPTTAKTKTTSVHLPPLGLAGSPPVSQVKGNGTTSHKAVSANNNTLPPLANGHGRR